MEIGKSAMPIQRWFCEACGVNGEVEYQEHADVMSVFHDINDDHRLRSLGTGCMDSDRIRVVNEQWYIDRGTTFEAEAAAGRVPGWDSSGRCRV